MDYYSEPKRIVELMIENESHISHSGKSLWCIVWSV